MTNVWSANPGEAIGAASPLLAGKSARPLAVNLALALFVIPLAATVLPPDQARVMTTTMNLHVAAPELR